MIWQVVFALWEPNISLLIQVCVSRLPQRPGPPQVQSLMGKGGWISSPARGWGGWLEAACFGLILIFCMYAIAMTGVLM